MLYDQYTTYIRFCQGKNIGGDGPGRPAGI